LTRPEGDKNRKKKNTPEGIKRKNIFVFSRYSLIKVKILQQWKKKKNNNSDLIFQSIERKTFLLKNQLK
jgi:hypothetical protein